MLAAAPLRKPPVLAPLVVVVVPAAGAVAVVLVPVVPLAALDPVGMEKSDDPDVAAVVAGFAAVLEPNRLL